VVVIVDRGPGGGVFVGGRMRAVLPAGFGVCWFPLLFCEGWDGPVMAMPSVVSRFRGCISPRFVPLLVVSPRQICLNVVLLLWNN
jgi:hypothetical protein